MRIHIYDPDSPIKKKFGSGYGGFLPPKKLHINVIHFSVFFTHFYTVKKMFLMVPFLKNTVQFKNLESGPVSLVRICYPVGKNFFLPYFDSPAATEGTAVAAATADHRLSPPGASSRPSSSSGSRPPGPGTTMN